MSLRILDSHIHFSDPSRPEGPGWPPADRKYFGPAFPETLDDSYGAGFDVRCVAVEASRREVDDHWLLALSESELSVAGVVLNLRPDEPGFDARMTRAMRSSKFCGIRLRPIASFDLEGENLHNALTRIEAENKTVEFGAPERSQRLALRRLAERYPKIQWILDHAGHPSQERLHDRSWRDDLMAIGQAANVSVKLSFFDQDQLLNEAVWTIVTQAFGVHRILYASNWPVSRHGVDISARATTFATHFGSDAKRVMSSNAETTYGIRM